MRGIGAAALAIAIGSMGCDQIQMQGVVKTSVTKNGQTKTTERKFTKLSELPDALEGAGRDLQEVTSELKKALIDAPPPGKVKLADVIPSLGGKEGDEDLDFLRLEKDADGKPLDFSYVQIGVPSYDGFFKSSMEVYALAFELDQLLGRTRQVASSLLGDPPGAEKASVRDLVGRAKQVPRTDDNADRLERLAKLDASIDGLAFDVQKVVAKGQLLVANGQKLVAGAPGSITNPKTALHLDLIVKGLKRSIDVCGQSVSLLGKLTRELS